jgi:hypothetical protein
MKTATILILGVSTAIFTSLEFMRAKCAEAASFAFSYSFSSGKVLSGTFDGDFDTVVPSKVVNLRNLLASYSGAPTLVFDKLTPPKKNNYLFLDKSEIEINGESSTDKSASFFITYDEAIPLGGVLVGKTTQPVFLDGDGPNVFSIDRFQVERTDISTPVPEPSTTAFPLLLGIGIIACQLKQNQPKAKAQMIGKTKYY